MSRETDGILARWRALERAAAETTDPAVKGALSTRIDVVRAEYQASVAAALGEDGSATSDVTAHGGPSRQDDSEPASPSGR